MVRHIDVRRMMNNTQLIDFIEKHNSQYINYCELVILPDGTPMYAIPSHILKLCFLWGVPEIDDYYDCDEYKNLYDTIPVDADPSMWLCENLGVVLVWYNRAVFPVNYTKEQVVTYRALVKNKCVYDESDVWVSIEESLIRERNNSNYDEVVMENLIRLRTNTELELHDIIFSD